VNPKTLGHSIQAFHFLLLVSTAFFIGWVRTSWLIAVAVACIVIPHRICGECPITTLSNIYLQKGGTNKYAGIQAWLTDCFGWCMGKILYFSGLVLGTVAGFCLREILWPAI